jgi:hypothetical protein
MRSTYVDCAFVDQGTPQDWSSYLAYAHAFVAVIACKLPRQFSAVSHLFELNDPKNMSAFGQSVAADAHNDEGHTVKPPQLT